MHTTDITLIYNSDKADANQVKVLMQSVHSVKSFNLTEHSLTESQLADLAFKLGGNIEDLVDPAYDDHISVHSEGLKVMCRKEMLTLMTQDYKLINTPILIVDNKVYKAASAYRFLTEQVA